MGKRFDPNDFLNDNDYIDYESMDEYPNSKWEETTTNENNDIVGLDDFDKGMQKMVAKMVTTYLLSKEAERKGIVGFEIMKQDTDEGFTIKSSFIVDKRKIQKPKYKMNGQDIDDLPIPEFIKEILKGGQIQGASIVGFDVGEFLKQVNKEEVDEDEQPKRKRGRPKKGE